MAGNIGFAMDLHQQIPANPASLFFSPITARTSLGKIYLKAAWDIPFNK